MSFCEFSVNHFNQMLSLPIIFSPLFIDPLFDLVFVSHASYCCIDANVTCDQVPEERTHERARKSPVAWIHDALVRVKESGLLVNLRSGSLVWGFVRVFSSARKSRLGCQGTRTKPQTSEPARRLTVHCLNTQERRQFVLNK